MDLLPAVSGSLFNTEGALLEAGAGVRAVFGGEHGAFLGASAGLILCDVCIGATLLGEAGYLYRAQIVGEYDDGLSLDLMVGIAAGGLAGYLSGAFIVGPMVGASLDYRDDGFVVGVHVRERVLFEDFVYNTLGGGFHVGASF